VKRSGTRALLAIMCVAVLIALFVLAYGPCLNEGSTDRPSVDTAEGRSLLEDSGSAESADSVRQAAGSEDQPDPAHKPSSSAGEQSQESSDSAAPRRDSRLGGTPSIRLVLIGLLDELLEGEACRSGYEVIQTGRHSAYKTGIPKLDEEDSFTIHDPRLGSQHVWITFEKESKCLVGIGHGIMVRGDSGEIVVPVQLEEGGFVDVSIGEDSVPCGVELIGGGFTVAVGLGILPGQRARIAAPVGWISVVLQDLSQRNWPEVYSADVLVERGKTLKVVYPPR